MGTDLLAVIALAFRACAEPLCCWEVRLDDGTLYRDEQGSEARFEIPRQGYFFEARAALGSCADPDLWSGWRRFDWMHPADANADGTVGLDDHRAMTLALWSESGRRPEATDYFYCLQAGEDSVVPPEIVPPPEVMPPEEIPPEVTPPEEIPPQEIDLEEIASGGSSAAAVAATETPLRAEPGALYLAAVSSKPHAEVTNVSGLGLSWTPVRSQCAGRSQTGVSVWQASGEPTQDEVVTATLSQVATETVIAASRYSAGAVLGGVVSANTRGVDGACSGGVDHFAYGLELETTEADSLVQAWLAMRHREHTPGPGFAEPLEVHRGTRGDVAGLALASGDAAGPPSRVDVSGRFSFIVDWAAVVVEIARPPALE